MRRHLIFIASIPLLFAACSSTPPATPTAAAPAQKTQPRPAPAQKPASTTSAAPASTLAMHLDPSSILNRERSVYFEYDDSIVQKEYTPVIERHGQYLLKNPTLKVVVEGNTDERGSSEYNLALGQRRAQAVKLALQLYGVKDAQIEAISFGREKPKATGHDEAAWRENRRADIAYAK